MLSSWINHASQWNPQVTREIKGRFKGQSVLFAIALSVILQLMVLGVFYTLLPTDGGANPNITYCLEVNLNHYTCVADARGHYLVDWQHWWGDITRSLHWLFMYGLMVPGVFMLVFDLAQEEQRGTLNFIRLSPQSAWEFLLGKILGVPSLIYVAAIAAVPFHVVAAVGAKLPIWVLLSFYVVLLGGCSFAFSAALLIGFLSKVSRGVAGIHLGLVFAFLAMGFTAVIFVPVYIVSNVYIIWYHFYPYFIGDAYVSTGLFPFGYNAAIAHAFVLINLAISTYWIWQALYRCFHLPRASIISKKQSYGLIAYLEVLLVTLTVYLYYAGEVPDFFSAIAALSVFNVPIFVGLIILLSDERQNVVDWARYRHIEARANLLASETVAPDSTRKRSSLWRDLVLAERSPSVVAIALNLLIFGALLGLLIVFYVPNPLEKLLAVAGVVITINLLMFYATIAQIVRLMRNHYREVWGIAVVGIVLTLPFVAATLMFNIENQTWSNVLLLMTPIPWNALRLTASPVLTHIGLVILGQWLAIALVNLQLTRQLKQAGQSATKQLLASK